MYPFIAPMADDAIQPASSEPQLIIAALVGIAIIITLITWLKVHPFFALTVGAVGVGIGAGLAPGVAVTSYTTGFGSTMGGVGVLIGCRNFQPRGGQREGRRLVALAAGADSWVDEWVDTSRT